MAGKIIADTIEASGSQISLNVGNTTILTASSTGLTLIPTTNVNVNLTNSIVTLTPGSATSPGLTFSGNTRTGLFMPSANTLAFTAANTESMRIDSSGNVGIGTTDTTNQRLKIKQSADTGAASFSFKVEANANDTGLFLGYRGVGAASAADTCAISASYVSTGAFKPITFLTSDAERMRIDSSGNVGIGTSSPRASKLDVLSATGTQNTTADNSGLVNITGPSGPNGAQPILVLATNDAMAANIGPAITFQARYVTSSTAAATFSYIQGIKENATSSNLQGALIFVTRNSAGNFPEAMRIDSSGNLLVGTTSQFFSGKQCIYFDGNSLAGLSLQTSRATTGSTYVYFVNSASAGTGSISQNGTNTVAYGTSSDYRLKENIAPMTGALDTVAQLKPVTYKWKADGSDGQGFIAHELQEVVPDCVIGEKDDVDAEGNPAYQNVDTSFLVATLTAAIQELKAIVDAQAVEIAALKAK